VTGSERTTESAKYKAIFPFPQAGASGVWSLELEAIQAQAGHARSAGGTELATSSQPGGPVVAALPLPLGSARSGWLAGPHTGCAVGSRAVVGPAPPGGLRATRWGGVGRWSSATATRCPPAPGTPQLSRPRPVGAAARTHAHGPPIVRSRAALNLNPPSTGWKSPEQRSLPLLFAANHRARACARRQGHACGSRHSGRLMIHMSRRATCPHVYVYDVSAATHAWNSNARTHTQTNDHHSSG